MGGDFIHPCAFQLQNTDSVLSWPREIQYGIFEMTELLVDLVGTRLRSPPVPITLLKTLAMVGPLPTGPYGLIMRSPFQTFDANTKFSQKHKNELLPARRVYTLLDGDFLREDYERETFGWLRSIIQRVRSSRVPRESCSASVCV